MERKGARLRYEKESSTFRDANCAVVLEVSAQGQIAIFANHPRMVRYVLVQLTQAHQCTCSACFNKCH
jgi:hypothetical protein